MNEITDGLLELATYLEELPYFPESRGEGRDWMRVEDLVAM